ncbi:MAG: hypothetical protein V9E98_10930 [Candidatus Nanopelagicales bacterium]
MKRMQWGSGLAGVALAALALTGCSTAEPGQAAVVGDARIPESAIADQMRSVNELAGRPAEEPSAELARTLVSYNLGYELIAQTAAELQVSIPRSQSDQVYDQQVQQLGGEEQLQQAAAQQGIPPQSLRRDLETQLLASAIANRLAPGGQQQAAQAALLEKVREVSSRIGVEVAPKYGVWDPEQLQLVPNPDPVARPAVEPGPVIPAP